MTYADCHNIGCFVAADAVVAFLRTVAFSQD